MRLVVGPLTAALTLATGVGAGAGVGGSILLRDQDTVRIQNSHVTCVTQTFGHTTDLICANRNSNLGVVLSPTKVQVGQIKGRQVFYEERW